MKDGFIKVAAITPDIHVADITYNVNNIITSLKNAFSSGVKLAVFPELCVTGYTCNDLFEQDPLLFESLIGLNNIINASRDLDIIAVIGLPFLYQEKLFNVAAIIHDGKLLGMVPKKYIPDYSEFYEARQFSSALNNISFVNIPELSSNGLLIPFSTNLIFTADNMPEFKLSAEICEDLWVPMPPSCMHATAGATIIANLSASDETTGKSSYRHNLISTQSASLICTYIYADAGEGESSTDLVFAGDNIIAENGNILSASTRFKNGMIISETDLGRLKSERRRINTFYKDKPVSYIDLYDNLPDSDSNSDINSAVASGFNKNSGSALKNTCYPLYEDNCHKYVRIHFNFKKITQTQLTGYIAKTPFVPAIKSDRDARCSEILDIQAMGLKKRLMHTHSKNVVIGISGGLDSTLALLVAARAFDLASLERTGISAITMPCFGTTDRTYNNACELVKQLGASLTEIPIQSAVNLHFNDISHDPDIHDVTYENSQARMRTMILMDVANQSGGLVIGTGDLSEMALGWSTYNGDHMSMYGVNCSIPKTLVRYLVEYYAQTTDNNSLSDVLYDILDTPVSPELLPPENGLISQKTEDLVGPYELHDFFLYYCMRYGYHPSKIYRMALHAFADSYDKETILKWLKTFYRRFFSQQFKRSCLPDGPKVGSVALSPRGDWRMPSDAVADIWLKELDNLL